MGCVYVRHHSSTLFYKMVLCRQNYFLLYGFFYNTLLKLNSRKKFRQAYSVGQAVGKEPGYERPVSIL